MAQDHLVQERIKKLTDLQNEGVNPYPHSYTPTHLAKDVKEKYTLAPEEKSDDVVCVAGRVVLLRRMGKATFLTIQDSTSRLQVYLRKDDTKDYPLLKKIDIGDFLGVQGSLFATKMGELTVYASEFTVLTKSIKSLPEKYHGLQDQELKYRKRHLDLIMNQESKHIFEQRLRIMQAIRSFFVKRGFLEVETPILQTLYGGAAAKPFITHHNDLKMDMYLRISPELYLKRLLVGGFDKVFEINKNFRNEGIDTTHNPEFTMLECYQSYADYNDMMEIMEGLYDYVAREVFGTTVFTFKGQEVDVAKPWKRVTMLDSIKEHAGIDASSMSVEDLLAFIRKEHIDFDKEESWGNCVAAIFEECCEDKYVNPTFIIDHPIETTPLCKPLRSGDTRLVERFEPFSCGMELGNAYTELNDPVLQRQLLEDQQRQLTAGDDEANPLDEEFLDAIETGMPPAGGLGIGIDRMIMLLTGKESIRDVIFFPTMKPE